MIYGRISGGVFLHAPRHVLIGNTTVYNPTAEDYKAAGYYPLIVLDPPTDIANGKHCEPIYQQVGETIVMSWVIVDDEVQEPSLQERVEAIEMALDEIIMGGI